MVNPVGVFGPVLGPDYSTSILLLKRMLDGAIPGCPNLWFGAVDANGKAWSVNFHTCPDEQLALIIDRGDASKEQSRCAK